MLLATWVQWRYWMRQDALLIRDRSPYSWLGKSGKVFSPTQLNNLTNRIAKPKNEDLTPTTLFVMTFMHVLHESPPFSPLFLLSNRGLGFRNNLQ
jgi:hypothetical protein